MSPSEIQFIDVTIRDGHQSLWATRMTTDMILPIVGVMEACNFDAIDVMGGAGFDVAVRFLKENPWQRLEILRECLPNSQLNVWLRGQSLFTFQLFPDEVVELTLRNIAGKGIDWITTFDPLNDLRNISLSVYRAKALGMTVVGALAYTFSPVHTDEYFASKCRELVEMGVDRVLLKDATGVLTPDRIGSLMPILVGIAGSSVPVDIHSHCRSGLAPQTYIEAMDHGVTGVHTAARPLANGASLPATDFVIKELRRQGQPVRVSEAALTDYAQYFEGVARRHGKPIGTVTEYDPFVFEHQIPGGMISNLHSQLNEAGLANRLPEILAEVARVRVDMGYPVIVSPFAQFVVTQATLNVIQGERYRTVPHEIQKYVLGYYGKLAGEIAPVLLERVGRSDQAVSSRAGEFVPPVLDQLRSSRGEHVSDDDLLLSAFYADPVLEGLPTGERPRLSLPAQSPVGYLLEQLSAESSLSDIELEVGDTHLRLVR